MVFMFTTLRGRLLLSYTLLIAAVLVILAVTLLLISGLNVAERGVVTMRELATISSGTRREMNRLADAGTLNGDTLQQLLAETSHDQNVRILIVRALSREVFFDTQPENQWVGLSLNDIDTASPIFRTTNNELLGRVRAPDGSFWLLRSLLIPDRTNLNGFFLVFGRPEPTAWTFFQTTFLRPLCSAGIIAFLLAVFLAYLISRSVSKPLQKLAGAAQAIASGHYNQQIPLEGPDEVQTVANSFNTMSTQVQATQQAQRDFVANVSHDLKTPLTSIQGWSQAMLDGMVLSPNQQQNAVSIIHSEAGRMTRMVNELLDLAKLESGQLQLNRQPVDLPQLLEQVHRNLSLPAQEKAIQFTLSCQPVPLVSGDSDRLMQIFTNLVDNALGHTPAGGQVQLSLTLHSEKSVNVVVQDTGAGISADKLPRIFERFYQVEKSRARTQDRRGFGLGLAIVRELVQAHGGTIFAQSELGKGTAFIVRLPISPAPEATTIIRPRSQP